MINIDYKRLPVVTLQSLIDAYKKDIDVLERQKAKLECDLAEVVAEVRSRPED